MDQETNARHNQHHHRRERIEQKAPIDGESLDVAGFRMRATRVDPMIEDDLVRAVIGRKLGQLINCAGRNDKRKQYGCGRDRRHCRLGQALTDQAVDDETCRGE